MAAGGLETVCIAFGRGAGWWDIMPRATGCASDSEPVGGSRPNGKAAAAREPMGHLASARAGLTNPVKRSSKLPPAEATAGAGRGPARRASEETPKNEPKTESRARRNTRSCAESAYAVSEAV